MVPRALARVRDLGTTVLLATAFANPLNAQQPGRYTRIRLSDSISVVIHLGGADTSVVATTPQGIFRLRADSSALAAWARASASLRGPTPRAGTGSDGPLEFYASVLRASDESGNAMRLLRLTGDSMSAYALRVSNGAWEGGGRIRPEMVRVLFRALSGSDGEGVEWHPYAPDGEYGPGFKNAEPAPGNPAPRYPPRAELALAAGDVVAQFTIGTDGRARPESLLIVSSTHPLFSLAVHDALPSMRFLPATKSGVPVETTVVQKFQFKLP